MSYSFTTAASFMAHADHNVEGWHGYLAAELPDGFTGADEGICCHTCETIVAYRAETAETAETAEPLGIAHSDASAGELAIVDADMFRVHYEAARESSPLVADMTSDWSDAGVDDIYRVSLDGRSGYAVRGGELVYVFSTVKGRGDAMMRKAIADGAYRLDCFDGYLTDFYGRHGFRETFREFNWTVGGPDVVWMHR